MSFAALKSHAHGLPGAVADIKWGCDWVASVRGKMFFVGGPEPGRWKGCSFKVDDERFLELTGLPGFAPAPYLARAKWVKVADPKALPLAELKALVARSHALVVAKLPKQERGAVAANPSSAARSSEARSSVTPSTGARSASAAPRKTANTPRVRRA